MAKVHIKGGSKLRFEFDEPVLLTPQAPVVAGRSAKWTSEIDTDVSPPGQKHVRVGEVKDKDITIEFKPKK